MRVLKFGGTSVGSPARMKKLLDMIAPGVSQVIVLSAVAGTTNALLEMAQFGKASDFSSAQTACERLKLEYEDFASELLATDAGLRNAQDLFAHHFGLISSLFAEPFTRIEEKIILAQGELISSALFHFYLTEMGFNSRLLPALDIIQIDDNLEPVMDVIQSQVNKFIPASASTPSSPSNLIYITQGYICRNEFGEIDNLQRGGSDYTASLLGAALAADEVQIWTDIDGLHNNDPRIVECTKPLAELSFEEAAELAYFGAKILHPHSIYPAMKANVPVRILSTLDPDSPGTVIRREVEVHSGIRAIAAKDSVTVLRIHSTRMYSASQFLSKVFEVFNRFKIAIDMITTAEVAVSLSIDQTERLPEVIKELSKFAAVNVDFDQSIVCVVGDFSYKKNTLLTRVMEVVGHWPVRMISYGGSDYNISLIVSTEVKNEVLRALHRELFNP